MKAIRADQLAKMPSVPPAIQREVHNQWQTMLFTPNRLRETSNVDYVHIGVLILACEADLGITERSTPVSHCIIALGRIYWLSEQH